MKKIAFALVLLMSLTLVSCGLKDDTINTLSLVFCQTTSDKLWKQNKDFIMKNSSDELAPTLQGWFEGTNYADSISVKLRDITITRNGNETKSMALLECTNDFSNYHVILQLNFTDDKLVDFKYEAVDGMSNLY